MNYIVKNSNPEKLTIVKDDAGNPDHITLDATINVGVDGQPDINISTGTTIRFELADTGLQMLEKFNSGITAFVAEKYPNT